jgi:hypothetical protein
LEPPDDASRFNPNAGRSSELFEVDLCDECSKKHDLAEFDDLPRTGCEWCWKRKPAGQLVQMPSVMPQPLYSRPSKDAPANTWKPTGRTGPPEQSGIEEMVCRECHSQIKRCSKCDLLHWKDDFAKDKKSRDGLTYICKDCRAAARKTASARARDAARKRDERRSV